MMRYDDLTPDERDRLRAAYDAGFAAGSCSPSLVPDDLLDLMDAVQEEWFTSLETRQAAYRAQYPMPGPEAIPEWLAALPASSPQLRAGIERLAALGDAEPPKGWPV